MVDTRARSQHASQGSQVSETQRGSDRTRRPTRSRSPLREEGQDAQQYRRTSSVLEDTRDAEEVEASQSAPAHNNRGQSGPNEPSVPSALQEMEKWYKRVQEKERLRNLLDLQARYNEGDPNAIEEIMYSQNGAAPRPPATISALPRPEPPHVFKKKDRAEYNRWERDCEGYFKRSPLAFRTDQQKVDFGTMYISEPLKTLWKAHCTEKSLVLRWFPTWLGLKMVMLDSLGTPGERKQMAYEQLQRARQLQNQSPTELLDYLRPLWEELGTEYSPQLQLLSYMTALRPEIKEDIEKLPISMRNHLWQVEEQANIVYRRMHHKKHPKDPGPTSKEQKRQHGQPGPDGALREPRKPKPAKLAQSGQPKRKQFGSEPRTKKVTCYNCGEPGHMSPDCKNPKKEGADPRQTKTEKDKGRRN
ncbi:hypothetical protein AG0111_0g12049 [Alternaria gaisen]|uniref:Uncharacterized protein n=1 Tax=Alternaria gaisen TaxID=167740 RepID=A0ACB6F5H9_9PLEO|nr:hypothetical protein AG0111_0g12049 [Alternaria gaisen]